MPANPVCQANDASLGVSIPDGTYPVQSALKPHPVVFMKWVAVSFTCTPHTFISLWLASAVCKDRAAAISPAFSLPVLLSQT